MCLQTFKIHYIIGQTNIVYLYLINRYISLKKKLNLKKKNIDVVSVSHTDLIKKNTWNQYINGNPSYKYLDDFLTFTIDRLAQINILQNISDFKNIYMIRKKMIKNYIPMFNIAYTWTDCSSLAYYIRSQFSRGVAISSILFGIKKSIPFIVTGLCIQITGRLTGAPRASKKKYVFGSCTFSTLSKNMEYTILKVKNRFGISSIKIWINYKNN